MTRLAALLTFAIAAPLFGAGCQPVIGDWDWINGSLVTFTARNTVLYNRAVVGSWTCADSARDVVSLRWNTGYVDTLNFDGNRVSGENNIGMAVSGTRRGVASIPPSSAKPPVSAPPLAAGKQVVMASGLLQKCLGITPGAARMTPGPATEPYCKQLPAAGIYDQAGARFKAGDHTGAARIVTQAAEMGNAVAQLRLALLYDQGDGVRRSSRSAFAWYSRAAAQGEPESQNQLGAYYELAEGVPENWDLAARLYQTSAMQGWMKGQFAFGRAYEFGIGVPQDRQQAIAWFQKAAAQGHGQAGYFAKWLRDPTNNIGFRDDIEHDIVIGGKLRFAVGAGDFPGVTFHNSAQRALYLQGQRNQTDRDEANVWRQIRTREYEDCKREGRDDCMQP